jgi:pimeloyl-ACP methyl ester carboxylesterase
MIVFSHANSFPASTYRVLFRHLKSRGFTVKAIEKYGHDPRYPISNNWPHVVQHLVDYARHAVEKAGEPVWLVGHSLGGFLSLMAASRNPELARGVVLVDSPILGGWRSTAVGVMKTTQMFGSLSPGAVSRNRRNNWPTVDAAFEHFRHKKAFSKWDHEVLMDYVTHGTLESDGKRILSFDRNVETQFYNTVPNNLEQLLAQHPLKCPVAFVGGLASIEMKQVGMATTERITKGRIMMLDGSHLFPMEKPVATAAAIEAALRNFSIKSQK